MLEAVLRFSIHNRWLVIVLGLMAGLAGVAALKRLPIDAVPDITNNQVQINTVCPALSPVEIEKQVTFTIETALAGIPGLQSTRSLSRNGFSQVTALFDDRVNIYFARQQVSERLNEAREGLPPSAEPLLGPIATGLGEVYMYAVEYVRPPPGEARDGAPGWQSDGAYLTPEGRRLADELARAAYLREVQDWIIQPQLATVKGVAGIEAIGGYVKQYHVEPDPMKLVSYGLTFPDVLEALERNNVSAGAGTIERNGEAYLVRAAGRIENLSQIEEIVVSSRGGVPVHIRDVVVPGGVRIGREARTGAASENGEEVVVGTAIMLIGATSGEVASAVAEKMREIEPALPPGVRARCVLNRTKLVDATIETVRRNLLEGAALVIVVLFVLLGNIRAALICAAAIPLSMLMTAGGMLQSGISGNLMSLGAIDFGLVVDGAVIIVENCLRRLSQRRHEAGRALSGDERLSELVQATREVIQPSAYGQAIIILVYVPILSLSGVEGKMFRPMAFTVIFALISAFVLSLTLIPALVAVFIRGKASERDVFLVRWLKAVYAAILRPALRLRWLMTALACAAFAGGLLLFTRLGQEFVPTLDEKDIAMHAMRIPSTGLRQSVLMQAQVERTVAALPEVSLVFSKTGSGEMATDPMPPNVSDTFVILKPESEWRSEGELDEAIAAQERVKRSQAHPDEHGHEEAGPRFTGRKAKLLRLIELTVAALPGNNYEFTQPIQMRFNELIAGVRGDVAIKVYGDDELRMRQCAERILEALQQVPGAADAKIEQTVGLPVLTIEVDREAISRVGLSAADVQEVVSCAIGGQSAGLVFEGDRRFELVVRLPEELREDIASLADLPIPLPEDEDPRGDEAHAALKPHEPLLERASLPFVRLDQVARISAEEGVSQISRENGKRRIVVQCNVRGRDLGSFVAEAQRKVAAIAPPSGGWIDWGGQYENLVAARERLLVIVPLCFLLIFGLLLSAFRSVRYSLLVFSAVPLGLSGGIASLALRDMPFSISGAVGLIALSGVAVLNGLVMVSFILQMRQEGVPRDEAILRGSLTRLRPVLMTALVASLGFLPMALSTGAGAEVQRPLATVVIGGLVTSTLLTLVVLPGLFRIFTPRDEKPASA